MRSGLQAGGGTRLFLVVRAKGGSGMKNITLSADERLIEAARERARAEHTTLNEEFRRWLADYARRKERADEAMALMERIGSYASSGGRKFTRDEMNER
jgi:chromosomal replication initiation ATPase DnaA